MSVPINEVTKKETLDALEKCNGNRTEAAKLLGICRAAFLRRLQRMRGAPNIPEEVVRENFEIDTTEDSTVITSKSSTIRTLKDALKEAKVDLKVWEVERHVINKWDQGSKTDKVIQVVELWQVKVWLKKKVPNVTEQSLTNLIKKLPVWKPSTRIKYPSVIQEKHLLEISLFDLHLGKLAWSPETENDYNIKLAENFYVNAIDDLLNKSKGFNIEQILFPIGNDFFHINNSHNTTVNETGQDCDSRLVKIFEIGVKSVILGIEKCLKMAPVNMILVPGNHDQETSYYLAKVIEAWFRNVPEVRVNVEPTLRKYVSYGCNLLGFTHGNEEPHNTLPLLMATEQSELWAKTTNRVWHLGHFHKKKETKYIGCDTFNGVTVQVLPSLSGVDAWHYKRGYVKGSQAAEAYLWNFETGYSGHFNVKARI